MQTLIDALHERGPGIQNHGEGVPILAIETGRMLGLRSDELEDLARGAGALVRPLLTRPR